MGSVSRRIRNDIRQKVTGSRRPKYKIRLRTPLTAHDVAIEVKDAPPEHAEEPRRWWQFLRRSR